MTQSEANIYTGYEMYKDSSGRIKNLQREVHSQSTELKDVKSELNALKTRVTTLETKVSDMEAWMAKPCLGALLETSFKKMMKHQYPSSRWYIQDIKRC